MSKGRTPAESPACGEDPLGGADPFAALEGDYANLSQTSLLSSELPSGTGVRRPSLQCPPGQLPSQGSPLPRVEHGGTFCRCPAFASPELWLLCDLLSRPGGPPPAKSLAAFNPAVLNGFIPLRLTHPSLPFLVQFQPNPDRRLAHTSERLCAHGGPRFRIMIPVTASHRICNLRQSRGAWPHLSAFAGAA